jgi:hypothetical protein
MLVRRGVGGHQHLVADREAGVEHAVAPPGRDIAGHGCVVVGEQLELSAEHPLVEPERLGAPAIEVEIWNDLHGYLRAG